LKQDKPSTCHTFEDNIHVLRSDSSEFKELPPPEVILTTKAQMPQVMRNTVEIGGTATMAVQFKFRDSYE
jgi:hypothetical protein